MTALSTRAWRRGQTPSAVSFPNAASVVTTKPGHRSSRLRSNVAAMTADGASFSVMVGIGETYLPAFMLAVGMSQISAGLITTVPLVVGGFIQLVSPLAIRRLGSNRRWVVLCAAIQAGSFLPLVVAALVGWIPPLAAFLIASLYWGAGMATGPAWNTWAGTIVPRPIRVRYFAWRTRISQAGVLVGFLAGGVLLQGGVLAGMRLEAFAVIFAIAALCRMLSAGFLASQSEPAPPDDNHRNVPIAEMFARIRGRSDGRLLRYLLAVQTAVQLSGPYFSPYMLGQLGLSYTSYMTLLAAAFLAKIIALPILGRIAHRFGSGRLLWIGGVGIVPVSGLWIFSSSMGYLISVQILSGFMWAAYELAMFLLFFESIPAEERTSVLTTFNFANAIATAAGSLIGGAILSALGKDASGYLILFGISSAARLSTVFLLARVRHGVPDCLPPVQPVATRTLAVRPCDGSIDRPILPSIAESEASVATSESAAATEPARSLERAPTRTSETEVPSPCLA